LLAGATRKETLARIRTLLNAAPSTEEDTDGVEVARPTLTLREPCPECGGRMHIVETFRRGERPTTRAPPRKTAA
ncbi:MAG: IS91 family transposase, partial [Pseudomonadota bacterium]